MPRSRKAAERTRSRRSPSVRLENHTCAGAFQPVFFTRVRVASGRMPDGREAQQLLGDAVADLELAAHAEHELDQLVVEKRIDRLDAERGAMAILRRAGSTAASRETCPGRRGS